MKTKAGLERKWQAYKAANRNRYSSRVVSLTEDLAANMNEHGPSGMEFAESVSARLGYSEEPSFVLTAAMGLLSHFWVRGDEVQRVRA